MARPTDCTPELADGSEVAATWEPIESLQPWDRNPRRNDGEPVDRVAKSIQRFGFGAPIVARAQDRRIIAGHTRWKAAKQLGMTQVPVRFMPVDEAEAAALALADNRLTEITPWDDEVLAEVLRDLNAQSVDLDGLGWSTEELDALLADEPEVKEEAEEPPAPADGPPDSQPGMVYELGPHRLACGDSMKAETWAALMVGERWAMLMTSPPYGQQRDYGAAKEHVQDWRGLMAGVFGSAIVHAEPDGQMLVNLGLIHRERRVVRYWDDWIADMDAVGWYLFGWYVWDQGPGMPGDTGGRLGASHEFVFHMQASAEQARKTKEKRPENVTSIRHPGSRGQRAQDGTVKGWSNAEASLDPMKVADSVIRVHRDRTDIRGEHPAVFPVGLPSELIPVWTDAGDIVAEPFGGSGTTLIACAMTDRVARLIELDPKYCDVIRRRWTRWARENGRDPGPGALEEVDRGETA